MKIKLKVDGKKINVGIATYNIDALGSYYKMYEKQELCKTWEEYLKNYFIEDSFYTYDMPDKYIAARKLELLRNHYNGGSEMNHEAVIYKQEGKIQVEDSSKIGDDFLNFKSLELAKQFSENFKDLIIEAGDLI